MEALTRAAAHSRKTYPHTPLRLYVEALGAVIKPVSIANAASASSASLPLVPDELRSEPLLDVPLCDGRQSLASAGQEPRRGPRHSAIGKHVQTGPHRPHRAH